MSIIIMVEAPGGILEIDISPETCLAIGGFLANRQIITPSGEDATILGVAPAQLGNPELVMWYQKKDGNVCWQRGLLSNLGFKPMRQK